jgi:predicted amidohydrolase YtcJ
MKVRILLFFLTFLGCIVSLAASDLRDAPDIILFNGKIFTNDTTEPYVQALAIRRDRVVAIGGSENIKSLAGKNTRKIDLGGRTVIPGINDAHNHIGIRPSNWFEMRFKSINPTTGEVEHAIAGAIAAKPKGTFLYGEIGPAVFHDTHIDRDSLDKIAPVNPVVLETFTGHAMILNSAALATLNVSERQPDPVGGRFERFRDGRLSGIVREYATFEIHSKIADLVSEADAVLQLREFFAQAARWGITSIQDLTQAPDRFAVFFAKTPTPLRVPIVRMPGTTSKGRSTQVGWPPAKVTNPLIMVNGVKWLLDGVPLEGTFLPREDVRDIAELSAQLPLTFETSDLTAMLQESLVHKEQLLVHVSGYPAASAMLKAMEAAGGTRIWSGKRVRFEHGDGILPDLIPSVKKFGIVVVQNPTHLAAGVQLEPGAREGFARLKVQPLRRLLAAGIPVALGSDGPMNPYLNIMLASFHPDRPDEAITREEAVKAYTLTSAYAEFAETEKGSLTPGKLADLAVLSQDIFTVAPPDLPKTESVFTLVGGKAVYDAGVLTR